jgi:hypothetical protein
MLKQLQHNRFRTVNEINSLTGCYWYVQTAISIAPIGNREDNLYKRPLNNYA